MKDAIEETTGKETTSKERSRAAFDAQAPTYDTGREGAHARRLYPHVVNALQRALGALAAPAVLDLGCGTGALARAIMEAVPGCRLTGIDLSPAMAQTATKRLGDDAEVFLGDAEHLPFPDGVFDAVCCNDSFHHYPDPERAAFQAWRVLKAGGVLVVGDVWQPAPARAIMNAWMPYSKEGDVRIYSEAEMREILERWFDEVSWRRIGSTACLAVARKGR